MLNRRKWRSRMAQFFFKKSIQKKFIMISTIGYSVTNGVSERPYKNKNTLFSSLPSTTYFCLSGVKSCVTRWLDHFQYSFIYSNENEPPNSNFKILPNTKYTLKFLPNTLRILPKWWNFAKSVHTGQEYKMSSLCCET